MVSNVFAVGIKYQKRVSSLLYGMLKE